MNVLDYMAMEICETKKTNKRLTRAFVLVSTISLSYLYSLSKQLKKEKEKRYELQKEMDELANALKDIPCEVAKDDIITLEDCKSQNEEYKRRLNEIYGTGAFKKPKGE